MSTETAAISEQRNAPRPLPVIRPESEFVTKSIVVHLRASTTPIDPEHRSSAESARNLPSEPKWNMSLLL